jgi:hypothetical protein
MCCNQVRQYSRIKADLYSHIYYLQFFVQPELRFQEFQATNLQKFGLVGKARIRDGLSMKWDLAFQKDSTKIQMENFPIQRSSWFFHIMKIKPWCPDSSVGSSPDFWPRGTGFEFRINYGCFSCFMLILCIICWKNVS